MASSSSVGCSHCGDHFLSAESLHEHVFASHPSLTFSCSDCDNRFLRFSDILVPKEDCIGRGFFLYRGCPFQGTFDSEKIKSTPKVKCSQDRDCSTPGNFCYQSSMAVTSSCEKRGHLIETTPFYDFDDETVLSGVRQQFDFFFYTCNVSSNIDFLKTIFPFAVEFRLYLLGMKEGGEKVKFMNCCELVDQCFLKKVSTDLMLELKTLKERSKCTHGDVRECIIVALNSILQHFEWACFIRQFGSTAQKRALLCDVGQNCSIPENYHLPTTAACEYRASRILELMSCDLNDPPKFEVAKKVFSLTDQDCPLTRTYSKDLFLKALFRAAFENYDYLCTFAYPTENLAKRWMNHPEQKKMLQKLQFEIDKYMAEKRCLHEDTTACIAHCLGLMGDHMDWSYWIRDFGPSSMRNIEKWKTQYFEGRKKLKVTSASE